MATQNSIYPWHHAAWTQLQQVLPRLPHALLLHGPRGTGKTLFAERFAQALLCEQPDAEGQACGVCPSCTWLLQYSHPDYRRVRPEALDEEEGEDNEEEGGGKKTARAARAPSKDIRIDQVRALADFITVSTHRSGRRVILMYPAEALNGASANALLKMLEEPPPSTVFILVTDSLDRLLPTILSRCRKFALPAPSREDALAWLKQADVANAEVLLAAEGGAPLAALEMAGSELRASVEEFVAALTTPTPESALKTAERLQKVPALLLVTALQRWLHDLLSFKLASRIRYYPQYQKQITALTKSLPQDVLAQALKGANDRRAVAEHPLSARLFIEEMLLDYVALFGKAH